MNLNNQGFVAPRLKFLKMESVGKDVADVFLGKIECTISQKRSG
jgi:hypothetical protein